MFDCKMAGILSGAGGVSCQVCTATDDQFMDRELVIHGSPINRHIFDALEMFGELEDRESFFSLPSNDRVNLTHLPVSTINIKAAWPLHSYTSIFRWFNLLVYHLNSGKFKCSPISPNIKQSMAFVRSLIQKQTGLKVDQPDTSGGTTPTGSVVRRAFSYESKYLECSLSVIEQSYHFPSFTHSFPPF